MHNRVGAGIEPAPPTPPGMRVRTGRYPSVMASVDDPLLGRPSPPKAPDSQSGISHRERLERRKRIGAHPQVVLYGDSHLIPITTKAPSPPSSAATWASHRSSTSRRFVVDPLTLSPCGRGQVQPKSHRGSPAATGWSCRIGVVPKRKGLRSWLRKLQGTLEIRNPQTRFAP
jgi:hypothetical protein